MYKEMVQRKKFPAVVLLFITLITVICLSDLLAKISVGSINLRTYISIFFNTLMVALCYIEFSKCKVKYRYSIVADQFIIHKIKGEDSKILEDIKLKDIEFIGKYSNCNTDMHISSSKKYMCSTFNGNRFCCVYKAGDKFKKFYFEPSDGLMSKIKAIKAKPIF